MSDKKAEGFKEWFLEHSEHLLHLSKTSGLEYLYCNLTNKHEKAISFWQLCADSNGEKLQAANKKLELLTKCSCKKYWKRMNGETRLATLKCQGCKNKQRVDNEFSGSGEC
jgi:hypothetical protein